MVASQLTVLRDVEERSFQERFPLVDVIKIEPIKMGVPQRDGRFV
jgi:hypothetical protein